MDITLHHPVEKKKARFTKWRPRQWRPKYAIIVGWVAAGKSYKWISENVEPFYTPQHISNIMSLEQALELQDRITKKIQDTEVKTVGERLENLVNKAFQRAEEVMDNDDLTTKSPFHILDRSLEIIKGAGHLRGGGNGSPNERPTNNIFMGMPSELLKQIAEGTEKANKAKELHSGGQDITEIAVITTKEPVEEK